MPEHHSSVVHSPLIRYPPSNNNHSNSLLNSGNNNKKSSIAYEPRTEAISPVATTSDTINQINADGSTTGNEQLSLSDSFNNDDNSQSGFSTSGGGITSALLNDNCKSTKDEQAFLVEKLKKVEAEILQTDLSIGRLRKQKAQLEQAQAQAAASSSYLKKKNFSRHDYSSFRSDQETTTSTATDTKQLSIAKLVYHENRAKAHKAHSELDNINGTMIFKDLPIYNQPSDNAIYHLNATKYFKSFKSLLISCFRERLQQRLKLEEQVSNEYNRRMEKWLKSIEQEDSQPSKRIRDAKTREFFEKQFPELKKARESGERFSRVGQRVARSDAELDELLDGITEREDQDKKVKSYAVIPPMLEEMRTKKPSYLNKNGYVKDIIAEYKEYQILNTWTDEEKEIFRENYLQNPKNFGLIASLTSRKNVANCVQYYYLSKKSDNYKQLLKRQQKRRTRSFVRPAQQTPAVPTANNNSSNTLSTSDNNAENKFNGVNNDKSSGDIAMNTDDQIKLEASQSISAQTSSKDDRFINDSDHNNANSDKLNSKLASSCCICGCDFKNLNNQFRNVTRSNYQLYGISMDVVKPGLKICYSCRFRHVKHPSFDEPSLSPEPMDDIIEDEDTHHMEVDPSVIQADINRPVIESCDVSAGTIKPVLAQQQQNLPRESSKNQPETEPPVDPEAAGKGPQRTCVRDIIYQAIEMSFQKPKSSDMPEPHQMKLESIQPENLPINPVVTQHSISNVLPIKPVLNTNHVVVPPPQPPMPLAQPRIMAPHIPIQNLPNLDPNMQVQVLQHQKQQQLQLDYNIRHQQFLSQQLQHQQLQQQQQLHAQHQLQQQQQIQRQQQLQQQQIQQQQQHQLQHQTQQQIQHQQLQRQQIHQQLQQQFQQQHHLQQQQLQLASRQPLVQKLPAPPQPQPPPPVPIPIPIPAAAAAAPPPPLNANFAHHPLNLCRKFNEPPSFPEAVRNSSKTSPPPMAHGAKGTKMLAPQVIENGVLNLSKSTPVQSIEEKAPLQTTLQSSPPTVLTQTHPKSPPSEPASVSSPPPTAATVQAPKSISPAREEDSRSPNLTGSPTSPSEMVIDESADVQSSPASSEHDETAK